MLLSNERDQGINRKYPETSENKTTTTPNLWNTTKAVTRGKFTDYRPTSKKKSQINNVMLPLKELAKEQTKPQEGNNKDVKKNNYKDQ